MAGAQSANFWAIQNEATSIDRFLSRVTNATIFADEEFAAIARRSAETGRFRLIVLPRDIAAFDVDEHRAEIKGRDVFLFSFIDFVAYDWAIAGAAAAEGCRYVDWRYDAFPSFIGYNDSWRQAGEAVPPPRHSYVIASTARSGSTFLSDLLLRNGFGIPKEHIRAPFIELIRQRDRFALDLPRLIATIKSRCAQNGYFATKIISGFYWPVLTALNEDEEKLLFDQLWSVPVVYLVRETKVEQAVSDFVANQTKTWHVHESADLDAYKAAAGSISFDFDKINGRYLGYVSDESRIGRFLENVPNSLKITYEDLVAATDATMRKVTGFISGGAADGPLDLKSHLVRTFSEKNEELCREFVREAKQRGLYEDAIDGSSAKELTR